jgi:hypothetical protein
LVTRTEAGVSGLSLMKSRAGITKAQDIIDWKEMYYCHLSAALSLFCGYLSSLSKLMIIMN